MSNLTTISLRTAISLMPKIMLPVSGCGRHTSVSKKAKYIANDNYKNDSPKTEHRELNHPPNATVFSARAICMGVRT